jgi:hypothetical protein
MKNSALILTEPDISKASLKNRQVGMAVNGTRLELLEVKPDPTVSPMKWFHVRFLDGELSGRTGYVSASNVREDGSVSAPTLPPSRSTSSNESIHSKTTNQADQYVLKTGALIVAEPKLASASEKSKQVGFAVTGTSLQLLDQSPTVDGAMSWRRVRVLSGDMKSSEGWVSARLIERSKCNEIGPIRPPKGFKIISEGRGFCGYQLEGEGPATHVIIADLDEALLHPICGTKTEAGIERHLLTYYWNLGLRQHKDAYRLKAATNGTWFRSGTMLSTPGSSLGLKCNGKTYDFGDRNSTSLWNNVQLLTWRPSTRRIELVPNNQLVYSNPEITDIAGVYSEDAPIRGGGKLDGRTIVGLAGCEGGYTCRYLLLYSSLGATLPSAIQASRSFGVVKIGILDGGWSTGFILDGQESIQTLPLMHFRRWIPHSYLIYERLPPSDSPGTP